MNSRQIHSKSRDLRAIAESITFYFLFILLALCVFLLLDLPHSSAFFAQKAAPAQPALLLFALLGFAFSWGISSLSFRLFSKRISGHLTEVRHNSRESEAERCERICEDISGSVYYSLSLLAGFAILRGSEFMPVLLGGKLDLGRFGQGFPHPRPAAPVAAFYLASLGHHAERLVQHLLYKQANGQFWSFTYHHSLAVALIAVSYHGGFLHFGLPVLLLHDPIEPFMNLSKLAREFRPLRKALMPAFVAFILVWVYTRLVALTVEVLPFTVVNLLRHWEVFKHCLPHVFLFTFALVTLFILNNYWLYLILQILYRKLRFGIETTPNDKKD